VREWPGELIVNVQGDEPEIEPETIDGLVEWMESPQGRQRRHGDGGDGIPGQGDPADPNLVKVVTDLRGHALYFSRSPIPFRREPNSGPAQAYYLHLGVYAYRWQFLQDFTAWSPSPLEQTEKLEQLRALEHGPRLRVKSTRRPTASTRRSNTRRLC
jgi:3-deoxy-manno-octulosonate cytidylyltransferase (CMP-KDO synthetase)